jgi:NADPH-dependent ferric siderophore reductase
MSHAMPDTAPGTAAETAGADDPHADDDPVATELAAVAPDLLATLDAEFADSVLLIGRILGERPGATAARVVGVDRTGADLVVTDDAGDHPCRLPFGNELHAAEQLTAELMALVVEARARSGEEGTTTAERMMQEASSIRTFLTHVVAVEDVTPHMRRITFGGGDLATFSPVGPDTFLYLLLPPPGRDELTIDQSFTWTAHAEMPDEDKPVGAYYTLRRWRPDAQELDILCVLHGDAGPASSWASRARPGDPVALWGPRTAYEPPDGTDWYLLVADETGLPAVAVILETLPPGTRAKVFVEVADAAEQLPLPASPDYEVTWLHRDGAPAGTTTLLADAVRAMPWPGGTPYVWGGGESRAMTAVRRHVRHEIGLPREAVSLVAYWRHAAHTNDPDDAA